MNLYNISKSAITSGTLPSSRQQLRSGQIIQGKVEKLYPENKADIQLGGKRLIAKLEVGLQAGEKYHFQVQSTANMVQLKVLGEELKGKSELDTPRLLQDLGLRNTKENVNLLNNFMRSKVPFDQQQLLQAVQILRNEKDKPTAIRILTEIVARNLPITPSVFSGLFEVNNQSATTQLNSAIQHLRATPNQHSGTHPLLNQTKIDHLNQHISRLTEQAVPFKTALVQTVLERNQMAGPAILRTFQGLSLVPLNIDFPEWSNRWQAINSSQNGEMTTAQNFPYQLSKEGIMNTLSTVNTERQEFVTAINQFLNEWGKQLKIHQLTQSAMSNHDFSAMEQRLRQSVLTFFPENQQTMLAQLSNSNNSLSTLYQAMQALGDGGELAHLLQIMQKAVSDEQFIGLSAKHQFLQHQNLFMQSLGLDYESQLLQLDQANKQAATIKGLLLQLMQGVEGNQTESNQKLLHFINGMQMKSVNETQTLLQANIQIPAERLGLIKDIEMEFEGRKTKDGEINPDFCRILFHLQMQRLDETVIDMNIHQRKISLTVFNNQEGIKIAGNLLKSKLTTNLEELGYELTGLQYKKVEEKSETGIHFHQPLFEAENKGVDFRI